MTPQETDPDLPMSVQESLVDVWVGGCLVQVQATADLYLHRTHSNTTGHTQTFNIILKVKVKLLSRIRLFVTPTDCSLPGSSVHGIFQVRVLEWGAIELLAGC